MAYVLSVHPVVLGQQHLTPAPTYSLSCKRNLWHCLRTSELESEF